MLLGFFVISLFICTVATSFLTAVGNTLSIFVFKIIPFILAMGLLIAWILEYYMISIPQ